MRRSLRGRICQARCQSLRQPQWIVAVTRIALHIKCEEPHKFHCGGDSRFTAAAAHILRFAKRGRLRTPDHHWGASSESATELKQGRCIVPTFITLMRSARTLLVGTYQTPFQFVAKQ